jgi:hypothetical protein
MPMPFHDDEDDDLDRSEFPDRDDEEGEDDDTMPCPYCRQPVYEDAERCPHCENYLSREDAPPQGKPWWIVIGLLVCLIIAAGWVGIWSFLH